MVLGGCSSYEGEFECPPGPGLVCASLEEVNRQIDEGLLGDAGPRPARRERKEDAAENCSACGPVSSWPPEKGVSFYRPKQVLSSGEVIPATTTYRRDSL